MMAWLEAGAALIVAALLLVRWLGSRMRLVWHYGPRRRVAVTATATVIRELPAARPIAIESPHQMCGTPVNGQSAREDAARWGLRNHGGGCG